MQARLTAVALAAACLLCGTVAQAQGFPAKPVKIVVPSSAGTGADVVARLVGQRLGDIWHQGVVIENQAGASGNIGMQMVAKSPPDGYTLVLVFINHAINPALVTNLPFDLMRDFKPVADIATVPLVLVAPASLPANSIKELVALAKSRAQNPLFYGSPGNGGIGHLAIELFKAKFGVEMTHTPYKAPGPMVADVVGNQVQLAAAGVSGVQSLVASGKLKALAVTSARRASAMPNVPTVAEAGMEDFEVSAWEGLLAPANTPDAIVNKIYADVAAIAANKEFVAQLNAGGLDLTLKNPAEFRAFLASELDKWAKVVKAAGLKVD